MRDLAKFLYTHNPFYLLSAASVLFGLRSAFDNGGNSTATNAWMLAGALAAYALLLAATAVLIVRVGKVWDDARTIALLVVLMVLAISSSFDRLCLDAPRTASALFAVSGVFALVTIEGLIRGLRIAFPWTARFPLYLLIILFFAFPPAINNTYWDSLGLSLPWRVLCFPVCAAGLTMTLLPAVWKSSQQFQNNGSPWAWPWYPWSVFFFVGVGICGRSYLMTLAFQVDSGLESTFGGYYLVPMGFAILILLSEMAIVEKSKVLRDLLLIAPFCLMVLALIPGGRAYSIFLFEFTRTLGSPLWLTVLGCFMFSVYFYLRQAEQKTAMIQAVLLAMTFIAPSDTRMPTLIPQNWWPLAVVSVIQFLLLARDRNSVRFVKGWIAIVAALGIWGQQHPVTQHDGLLLGHALLLGVIMASLIFADRFAKWLRARLPLLMLGLPVIAAGANVLRSDPRWLAIAYVVAFLVVTVVFWLWHRMHMWKWASIGCICVLSILLIGSKGTAWNIQSRSTQALLVGGVCFALGGAISAAKAGLARGVSARARNEWEHLLEEWRLDRKEDAI